MIISPAVCPLRKSLPTRGAWIEISGASSAKSNHTCRSPHGERGLKSSVMLFPAALARSLPTRGAWIEILYHIGEYNVDTSLPTRGAWIEIFFAASTVSILFVAPHTGSVD